MWLVGVDCATPGWTALANAKMSSPSACYIQPLVATPLPNVPISKTASAQGHRAPKQTQAQSLKPRPLLVHLASILMWTRDASNRTPQCTMRSIPRHVGGWKRGSGEDDRARNSNIVWQSEQRECWVTFLSRAAQRRAGGRSTGRSVLKRTLTSYHVTTRSFASRRAKADLDSAVLAEVKVVSRSTTSPSPSPPFPAPPRRWPSPCRS